MKKERLKIGLIHLIISILLVAVCLVLILRFWYPDIMSTIFGLNRILAIFVIGNLLIFPALSALVCKQDKREQKQDTTILSTIQILISGAMLYFMYQSHPVWSALVVDSFEIVRIKDLQDDGRQPHPLAEAKIFQPYKIVGASFSKDPEIAKKQKNDDLFGISIAWYPSAVVPLSEKIDTLQRYAQPLEELKKYNPEDEVTAVLKKYPQATNYFPLRGFVKDGTMLTNKDFTWFQPVNLWPWEDDSLYKEPETTSKEKK